MSSEKRTPQTIANEILDTVTASAGETPQTFRETMAETISIALNYALNQYSKGIAITYENVGTYEDMTDTGSQITNLLSALQQLARGKTVGQLTGDDKTALKRAIITANEMVSMLETTGGDSQEAVHLFSSSKDIIALRDRLKQQASEHQQAANSIEKTIKPLLTELTRSLHITPDTGRGREL